MALPAIHADFMNADPRGRLRLNTVGTVEDLGRLGVRLTEGLRIVVHDDEVEADGVVSFSPEEHLWVAAIDWNAVRHVNGTGPSHVV